MKKVALIALTVTPILVWLPLLAAAQGVDTGIPEKIVTCSGIDCNFCSVVDLVQNILNFAIYLAVIGAALLFAWAGALYLTSADNPGQRTKAKALFRNVAIGFVIMFSAWFVVDILMKDLTEGKFQDWYGQLCTGR